MTLKDRNLQVGDIVRHFKGHVYEILDIAIHTETGETLVIYQQCGVYTVKYARPESMFCSLVDKSKYPNVEQEYRFEKLYDRIQGMCCDCKHGNGHCCDYSGNNNCKYQKEDGAAGRNAQMDYEKITEALETLQDMCNYYELCCDCPCGSDDGLCRIWAYIPEKWNINRSKANKCLE